MLVTLAAAVAALAAGARGARDRAFQIGAMILCPAAAVTATQGQNALLTAALLIGGFRLLPGRPILAGALLGLLTIKPQFWLLAPVALIAARHWRALGAAVATSLLLAGASAAVFGLDVWCIWIETAANPPPDFRASGWHGACYGARASPPAPCCSGLP
ncbi:MAG TPA: glycosyltransferase family 87 protein [Acetobacteraceae bacterium]